MSVQSQRLDGLSIECWPCRHYQREHTGPHEWHHQCAILAQTFPRRCRRYEREPGSDDQVGDSELDGEGV